MVTYKPRCLLRWRRCPAVVLLGLLQVVSARTYVPEELEVWKALAEQTRQHEWTHCNTPTHVSEPCSCNRHEQSEIHDGVYVHCVNVGSVRRVQRVSLRDNNLNGLANVSLEAFTELDRVDLRDNTQLVGSGPGGCLDPMMLCKPGFAQGACLLECTKEGCQTEVCEVPTGSPTTPTLTGVPTESPVVTLAPTSVGTEIEGNVTEITVIRPGASFGQTLNAVVMILLLVLPFCGGVLFLIADRDDVVENADGTQRARSKWYFTSLGTIDLNEDARKNQDEIYGQSVMVA